MAEIRVNVEQELGQGFVAVWLHVSGRSLPIELAGDDGRARSYGFSLASVDVCVNCDGARFLAWHALDCDGGCTACPIQVPCDWCDGTGKAPGG